jgi:hypothetical protein
LVDCFVFLHLSCAFIITDITIINTAGGLLEDVEVSSVDDLESLTSQLQRALKESGGATDEEFEMTEEEKQKIAETMDEGW